MRKISIRSHNGKEYTIDQSFVSVINPDKCVNCNSCREACPVQAIEEQQRTVCHICPECTEIKGITVNKMYSLPTETSCTTACPLGISPQGYLTFTEEGKYEEAYELVWSKNPLSAICGHICHHPCEDACKRGLLVDYPLSIRRIKRYLSEKVDYSPKPYPSIYSERIAIVGSGPAGLSAGHFLAQEGYDVTIFESAAQAGGMLMRGIPAFRLDRDVLQREIDGLVKAGLKINTGVTISQADMGKLQEEYDAVILAVGKPYSKVLDLPGKRMNGVRSAMEYMQQVNNGMQDSRKAAQFYDSEGDVVVIGGGNVAFDTARTALRLGAKTVTIVCPECGDDVPVHEEERADAEAEGIKIIEAYSPKRYLGGANIALTAVEFVAVSSCEKDDQGNVSFVFDEDDMMELPADQLIIAIGQYADQRWYDWNQENVFYAGDVREQDNSVIVAMGSGRKAALEVDAFIRGRLIQDKLDHELHLAPSNERIYPFNNLKVARPQRNCIPMEERKTTFNEVEKSWDDRSAKLEALSCMHCGYQKVDPDKCIGCGTCKTVCPAGDVISFVAIQEEV
ncbi:MAG: FAD-dependent oxidoreductase [Clostridiaceae bacterium]|nr:FAD-dependent oxidoreductase [Clostridiaceae bacterium]